MQFNMVKRAYSVEICLIDDYGNAKDLYECIGDVSYDINKIKKHRVMGAEDLIEL